MKYLASSNDVIYEQCFRASHLNLIFFLDLLIAYFLGLLFAPCLAKLSKGINKKVIIKIGNKIFNVHNSYEPITPA